MISRNGSIGRCTIPGIHGVKSPIDDTIAHIAEDTSGQGLVGIAKRWTHVARTFFNSALDSLVIQVHLSPDLMLVHSIKVIMGVGVGGDLMVLPIGPSENGILFPDGKIIVVIIVDKKGSLGVIMVFESIEKVIGIDVGPIIKTKGHLPPSSAPCDDDRLGRGRYHGRLVLRLMGMGVNMAMSGGLGVASVLGTI